MVAGSYVCAGMLKMLPAKRRRVRPPTGDARQKAARDLTRVRSRIAAVSKRVAEESRKLAKLVNKAARLERVVSMSEREWEMLSAARSAQAREAAEKRKRGARSVAVSDDVV